MNKGTIIEIKDLCKSYGKDFSLVKALDHISLTIEEGTFTAIVGASGSGKSTLLHMMGGLDTPDSGQVLVAGRESIKTFSGTGLYLPQKEYRHCFSEL